MNGYEKLVKTIRAEAKKGENPHPIKLGRMKSAKKCVVGQLELDSDDLMVNENLEGNLEKDDEVIVVQINHDLFAIIAKVVEM